MVTGPEPRSREVERPWLRFYEPGVPEEIAVPELTVDVLLRQAAEAYPSADALIFFGARTTFRRLDEDADRLARALRDLGVEPGDRVSLHLPTSPAFVLAFLGAVRAGAFVVPVSPLLVQREIEVLLAETRPRLSVALDVLVPRVAAARIAVADRLPRPRRGTGTVSSGIQDSLPRPLRWLYPLRARREGRWHPVPHSEEVPNLFRLVAVSRAGRVEGGARPTDPVVLQPTGGTTGTPKTAILSHRNLVANAHQVAAWFVDRRSGEDRVLGVLPYFHIYGLTVAMLYALLTAAAQILLPRFEPLAVLQAIQRWRPRLFPGAPVMYAALLADPRLSRFDLRSIAACISGAAPLPLAVQEGFERATGGRVVEGYGLTEASPVTHCNPIHGTQKLGSIGVPLPSTEARIVDLETGERTLPPGETGELVVRGPQVMAGYWEHPDETAAVLRDGWLFTGDLAVMDADGFFRIVDRRKELIKVSGVNVYPREVEDVLLAHPAVAEAAVIGIPHPLRGEVPKAFVVLRPGATASAGDLVAHCRANLAPYKVPAEVEIRSELPRTFVGKLLRRVLAAEERRRSEAGDRPAGWPAGSGGVSGATPGD
ncbi:MAG: long-chain fatty acid--CoA ligase [Chloroflexota bacterium]